MTREQVTECTTVVTPLDLVFLVDSSGSIEQNNAQGHNRSKQFVKDVTNDLPVGDGATDTRVAVVQFSSQLKQTTEIELTDGISKSAVEKAVVDMEFHSGGTHIGEGIKYATKFTFKHARPGAAKMLIVIADGNSADDTQTYADAARSQGIGLVAVGVGNGIDEKEMQNIAGSNGKVLSVKDYGHLATILANTTEIVCDEVSTPKPTPAPTPRPTPAPTWPADPLAHTICVRNSGGYALDFWAPGVVGKTRVLLGAEKCVDMRHLGLTKFQQVRVNVKVIGGKPKTRMVHTVAYYSQGETAKRTCTGTIHNWKC